ncbi:MAG: hypothetical protein ATN34_00675 [Epulopiscium sp. Nele67-Bin002]|nr:MAG: hypothetical protein ATN34_00675 [Epulopiscium sp. Nele67-Bin002]
MQSEALTYLFFILFFCKDVTLFHFISKVLFLRGQLIGKLALATFNVLIMANTGAYINSMSKLCSLILFMYLIEVIIFFEGPRLTKAVFSLMVPLYGIINIILVAAVLSFWGETGLAGTFTDEHVVLYVRIGSCVLTILCTSVFIISNLHHYCLLLKNKHHKLIIFFALEIALMAHLFISSLMFNSYNDYSLGLITLFSTAADLCIFLISLFMLVGFEMMEDKKNKSNPTLMDLMYKSLVTDKSEYMVEVDCNSGLIVNYMLRGESQEIFVGTSYEKVGRALLDEKMHIEDKAIYYASTNLSHMLRNLSEGISSWEYEYRLISEDGEFIWYRDFIMVSGDENGSNALIVTNNIQSEKSLTYCATIDDLTGIFNRRSTQESIDRYLATHQSGYLIILDIDNFKLVNDNLGHGVGDMVLKEVSQKLTGLCRPDDIVGRLGGDEFIMFLKTTSQLNIIDKARQLCNEIEHTYSRDGIYVTISASVGICGASAQLNNFARLYEEADKMLYVSKEKGKNTFTIAAATLATA